MWSLLEMIQDALIVAFELGLRYLWMDALCIAQDDKGNKDIQLDFMPIAYDI